MEQKRLWFLVILICLSLINLQQIEAQSQPSTVAAITGLPITFQKYTTYYRLNNTMFVIDFYNGTFGYNKIYSKNGTVLVYDDRITLEYLQAKNWKSRATPQNVYYKKIDDYWYNLTRTYDDFLGTKYNVTYVIKSDSEIKISIKIVCGTTDVYRLSWQPSGIVLTDWYNKTTRLEFGKSENDYNWIGFDWLDVKSSFGDITESSIESVAQGRKANIHFNIGTVNNGQTKIIDPSTVGTSTTTTSFQTTYQRSTFYYQNLHWIFYTDGTDGVFRTSSDGSSWSSATIYGSGSATGYKLSLKFNGTHLHYARCSGRTVYWRVGAPQSDGSISWVDVEQSFTRGASGSEVNYPTIAVDSTGHAFIAYRFYDKTDYTIEVAKNANNGGTWSAASGFPYEVDSTSDTTWRASIVGLTDNKMYVVYMRSGQNPLGQLWTGSSWDSPDTITASYVMDGNCPHSATSQGDYVYFVFREDANDYYYGSLYTYGSGWGSVEAIETSTSLTIGYPAICSNGTDNDYTVFTLVGNAVKSKRRVSGSWDADWTTLYTEVQSTGSDRLRVSYEIYNTVVGICTMNKSGSPYQIRYAYYVVSGAQQLIRTVSLSLTSSLADYRLIQYKRANSLSMTSSFADYRIEKLLRSVTMPISSYFQIYRLGNVVRSISCSLSTSWAAEGIKLIMKVISLSITSAFDNSRQINYLANPLLVLISNFNANWPVPVPPTIYIPINFSVMAFLFVVPLVVGLLGLKTIRFLALISGLIIIIFASYLALNPYLAYEYHYDAVLGWSSAYETIPFHPALEIVMIFIGAILIVAFASGEGSTGGR